MVSKLTLSTAFLTETASTTSSHDQLTQNNFGWWIMALIVHRFNRHIPSLMDVHASFHTLQSHLPTTQNLSTLADQYLHSSSCQTHWAVQYNSLHMWPRPFTYFINIHNTTFHQSVHHKTLMQIWHQSQQQQANAIVLNKCKHYDQHQYDLWRILVCTAYEDHPPLQPLKQHWQVMALKILPKWFVLPPPWKKQKNKTEWTA